MNVARLSSGTSRGGGARARRPRPRCERGLHPEPREPEGPGLVPGSALRPLHPLGRLRVLGEGEWVMQEKRLTIPEYERELPPQFNPLRYDPAAWVAMVKAAGMKYITITSKHHDGFAMFDSKVSDYDVVQKHALRQGRPEAPRRRVPEAGHQALLLPLAARLASSRLLPPRAHGPLRRPPREGRLEPLPRLHGRAAQGAPHRTTARSAGSGSTAGGTSPRPSGASARPTS